MEEPGSERKGGGEGAEDVKGVRKESGKAKRRQGRRSKGSCSTSAGEIIRREVEIKGK